MNTITIVLPLPPKELSTNGKGHCHWSKKSAATRAYRRDAKVLAMHANVGGQRWKQARATAAFFWPTRVRRDIRNAEATLKAAYDGIVDSGILPDDDSFHLRHGETTFDYDTLNPRVEITLVEIVSADEPHDQRKSIGRIAVGAFGRRRKRTPYEDPDASRFERMKRASGSTRDPRKWVK